MRGKRLKVKVFKTSNSMHKFLNEQYDNSWKINSGAVAGAELPHKAGTYAYAGGKWHNVKQLDPCVLAHI